MGRTACTEPQCLYKGALYLYLRVELYLYSPYGPYGLYRASVPVQGCTLPSPETQLLEDMRVYIFMNTFLVFGVETHFLNLSNYSDKPTYLNLSYTKPKI